MTKLSQLPEKIREGRATVCVIGLGRVGLPLAIVLARSGFRVIGVDVDQSRVSLIAKGNSPFYYPAIHDWLRETIGNGSLSASTASKNSIESSDIVVVSVGTPTGQQYQLDYLQLYGAFEEVSSADLRNRAIIARSTASPGTLLNIILPLLTTKTHLKPDVDFALAVCPERILEGQAHRELYELPEIVGGVGDMSNEIASELFRKISPRKKILTTTPTAAELAKLFTNVYRYVNFALANEFAIWSEIYGEDAKEVISIANDGYSRSHIPLPGFTGGPCLGKDGFLLDNSTFSSIVSVAWKLNEAIPQHVVATLRKELGSIFGKKIAVLGISFKADSDDIRLSPSLKLVEILRAFGAEVLVHDPNVPGYPGLDQVLRSPDAVVMATNHSAFKNLAGQIDESGCRIVYDIWGAYKPEEFAKAKYRRFGRGK